MVFLIRYYVISLLRNQYKGWKYFVNCFFFQYQPNFVTWSGRGPPPRYYMGIANISARLISAELAQVVWISSFTGRHQVSNYKKGGEVLLPVARIVANGLPSR